jgi:hypothetical protein
MPTGRRSIGDGPGSVGPEYRYCKRYAGLTLAVALLYDGAAEGRRVKAEAGPQVMQDEYIALRRNFDSIACCAENGEAIAA